MHRRACLAVAAFLLLAAPAGARQKPADPPGGGGRWIVLYHGSAGSVDAETAARERAEGFRATRRFKYAVRGFAARLTATQVADLRADPDVASVTPDRPVRALGETLAGGETVPTGIRRIGAVVDGGVRGASGVGVAVIDTGVDLDHPDLDAQAGVDCTGTGSPEDDHGHGTHVAGTIAARNTGAGVVGVAPGTKVHAVKVLDGGGSGFDSWVVCGLDWVAQNAPALDIKVANMSLGGLGSYSTCGTNDDPLHEAVCRVTAAGVTVVAAAGNDGWDFGAGPPDTPAWFPEALTVAAMTDTDGAAGAGGGAPSCDASEGDDAAASFSNFATAAADAEHTIAGPGTCILSTYKNGQYATASGTSMAAPHVAGEVALCLGENGGTGPCAGLTPAQIVVAMRADAAGAGEGGFLGDPAHPLSNRFYGFLGRAPGASFPPPPPPPTPPAPVPAQPATPPSTPRSDPPAAPRRCYYQTTWRRHVHRRVYRVRRKGRMVRKVRRFVHRHKIRRLVCLSSGG
jgi:subtilisin